MTLSPSSSTSSLTAISEAPEPPKPIAAPVVVIVPRKRYNEITKPPVPKASDKKPRPAAAPPSSTFVTQTVFEEYHPVQDSAKALVKRKEPISLVSPKPIPESNMPPTVEARNLLLVQVNRYKRTVMAIVGADWPYVVPPS